MHNSDLIKSEKGMALVFVTITLALAMLVIPPLLGFIGGAGRSAQRLEDKMEGYYAADAGWELASYQVLNELLEPGNGTTYIGEDEVNGYDVYVVVDTVDDATYRITSTATNYEGSTTIVVSHIYRTLEFFQAPLFDHAITTDESITLRKGNTIEGNIHSNGEIVMDQGTLVLGNASAVGEITGGNVTGNRIEGTQPIEWPPEVETQGFIDEAKVNTHPGDYTIGKGPATIYLGPLYVTGDLHIGRENTVVIEGTVYVEGSIKFDRNSNLIGTGALISQLDMDLDKMLASSPDDHVFILSTTGSINVDQQVDSRGLIYAPNGDITLNQGGVFSGAIVGTNILVNRYSSITYERITDIWNRLPGGYSPTEFVVLDYIIQS